MFTPIETKRLLLRPMLQSDADALHARRNDPEVAKYQTWELPYSREKADALVESVVAMDGPQNDEWWVATVQLLDSGEILGDLPVHLSWQCRSAEIGYAFDREHWGNGYAVEAVKAIVEYLFEQIGVTRIMGMLHPDNVASAMVLERTGFLFEGHTRKSFWVGDEVSDDHIYGMLREDWNAWRTRPRNRPDDVRLIPLDSLNNYQAWKLKTHKSQERFVSPMSESFTDALFPEVDEGRQMVPWMRAIEADGVMVGFVMLAEPTDTHSDAYLWRFLIDRLHQRRGIGRLALDLTVEAAREMRATSMTTSWVEGRGTPAPFYQAYGFVPTGRIVDEETEATMPL